jgi:hypothetical protein
MPEQLYNEKAFDLASGLDFRKWMTDVPADSQEYQKKRCQLAESILSTFCWWSSRYNESPIRQELFDMFLSVSLIEFSKSIVTSPWWGPRRSPKEIFPR